MAAVCSVCNTESQAAGPCPRCGGQADARTTPASGPRWQQTALGRVVIGLVVAQGLFYGLRQLMGGAMLAIQGGTAQELWQAPHNILALQALQVFAMLVGGALAGGGQLGGAGLGLLVGAWNGVLSLLLQQVPPEALAPSAIYATPLVHALAGAMGGLIGKWIWRPLPEAVEAGPHTVLRKPAKRKSKPMFAGPIAWVRVALGAALAVAGTLSAARLVAALDNWSRGQIAPTDDMQEKFVLWEIRALSLLLGGMLAGALTRNGLKQGLAVGIAASIALVGLQTAKEGAWLQLAVATVAGTFSLSLIGGWFGGALFPPVVAPHRRMSAEV